MISMPAVIVLIVCKTVIAGPPDANAGFTKNENRDWAYENSMMVCKRQEVEMMDQAADSGSAEPQPFNENRCMMSAMILGAGWDAAHPSSKYRFWRVACPVKIVDPEKATKDNPEGIVGYKLPECGHEDTVVCLVDSEI